MGIDLESDVDTPPATPDPGATPPADPPAGDPPPDEAPPQDPPAQDDPPEDPPPAPAEVKFDKDDEPFLKKMHKDASTHFGKKIAGLKETLAAETAKATDLQAKLDAAEGKRLPDSWYEHPDAFRLSPQYTEISTKFEQEQGITNFWTEQLRRCKANASLGESDAFIPYEMVGPDGKLMSVTEDKHTAANEVTIADIRQRHYRNQEKLADEGNQIQKTFLEQHKKTDAEVRAAVAEKMPWVKDEKHPFQKTLKEIQSKLPATHRNSPFGYAFAVLCVQHLAAIHENKELRGKKAAQDGLRADQRAAGPIPGKAGAARSTAADTVYKPDDLVGL